MVLFLAGFFIGLVAALKLSHVTASFLSNQFEISEKALPLISLLLTFLVFFFAIRFISAFLEKILKTVRLNFINRTMGGLLSSLLAFAAMSIAMWYATELGFIDANSNSDSYAAPILSQYAPDIILLYEQVLPFMKGLLRDLTELFENIG